MAKTNFELRTGDTVWCYIHGEFCMARIAEITNRGTAWVYSSLAGEAELSIMELGRSPADF